MSNKVFTLVLLLGGIVAGLLFRMTDLAPAPFVFREEPLQRLAPIDHHVPSVDPVVYCDSMKPYVRAWCDEIARRYPDCVAIFCHGGDDANHWTLTPDMDTKTPEGESVNIKLPNRAPEDVIAEVRRTHPGRLLVLMSCNPGHYKLDLSGVVYCPDLFWMPPDRDRRGGGVGSIWEFSGP